MVNVGSLRDLVRSTIIEIVSEKIVEWRGYDLTDDEVRVLFSWYNDVRRDEERSNTIVALTNTFPFTLSYASYDVEDIYSFESFRNSMNNSCVNPEEANYDDDEYLKSLLHQGWRKLYDTFFFKEDIKNVCEEVRKRLQIEIVEEKWRNISENDPDVDMSVLFKMGYNHYKIEYSSSSYSGSRLYAGTPVNIVHPKKIEIEIFE